MSVGVFIPVRLGSTRLPRKHLLEVKGFPLLTWLIRRMKHQLNDQGIIIAIASTDEPMNQPLAELADQLGIKAFWGNRDNIPLRFSQAAEHFSCEKIICVDGDDIACSPRAVRAVKSLLENGFDCIETSGLPLGFNVQGFSKDILDKALQADRASILETGWGRIFEKFSCLDVKFPLILPDVNDRFRFTLDYEEDFLFFKSLIEIFDDHYVSASDADLCQAVIDRSLMKINDKVNDMYWENFNKAKAQEAKQIFK